jgi:hypothetical protein
MTPPGSERRQQGRANAQFTVRLPVVCGISGLFRTVYLQVLLSPRTPKRTRRATPDRVIAYTRSMRRVSFSWVLSGFDTQAGRLRGQTTAIRNQQSGRSDAAAVTNRERSLYLRNVRAGSGYRPTTLWPTAVRARREERKETSSGSSRTQAGRTAASPVGQAARSMSLAACEANRS